MTDDEQRRPGEPEREGESPGAFDEEEIEILGFEGASDSDEPAEEGDDLSAATDETIERELAELQDRHLRLRADFDNFRKRIEREREETRRYALSEPLRELLPVLDNLERAATAQGKLEDLQRGVEMIARQLWDALRRFGLAEVPGLGEPFDPQVHEAVAREESDEVERPTVVAELQRGFRLHDRLLRPAMVRVAVPPEAGSDGGAEEEAAEPETASRAAVLGEDS